MIRLENLTKKYSSTTAVDNINLEIPSWKCFALLWRNWAGKSTTIKMIVWITNPTSWDIFFDGRTMQEDAVQIKSEISYIPDMPYVYEKLTWIDFLYFVGVAYWMSKQTIRKKAQEFYEMFDFYEMLDKKVEDYSHGMRQKLVFTAALMHNPKYLILDEPMVGLDYQWAYIVKKIIKSITEKLWCTVILTTHQIYVAAEISDEVGIIHDWKLVKTLKDKDYIKENLEDTFLESTWTVSEKFEQIITQ